MTALLDLPKPEEIEVSLFGPGAGYGECLAVHLGGNRWITIDSCIDPTTKLPAALAYFQKIGVNPAESVDLVVASHWHDDHVRGLARLLDASKAGKFVCPAGMVKEDFIMLSQVYLGTPLAKGSGACEYTDIHEILQARSKTGAAPIRRASASQIIGRLSKEISGHGSEVVTYSLTPSDPAVAAFIKKLSAIIAGQGPRRGLPRMGPNDAAVVVQIVIGNESVLLGSDLENSSAHGWSMVVADTTKPPEKSHVFKVAHHGSETGEEAKVWSEMLHAKPVALLTPFRKGSVRLPKGTDVTRIKGQASKLYVTVPLADVVQRRKYSRDIEKGLAIAGVDIRLAQSQCGHIRFRFTPGDHGTRRIDLFDGAVEI